MSAMAGCRRAALGGRVRVGQRLRLAKGAVTSRGEPLRSPSLQGLAKRNDEDYVNSRYMHQSDLGILLQYGLESRHCPGDVGSTPPRAHQPGMVGAVMHSPRNGAVLACELRAVGCRGSAAPQRWFRVGQGSVDYCRRREMAWKRGCLPPGRVELRLVRLCGPGEVSGSEAGMWAYEGANGLRYEPESCRLARPKAEAVRRCLKGAHLLFFGDSVSRYLYLTLAHMLVRGGWPTDAEMSEATCGTAATCGATPCFEGGSRRGVDEATRWASYYNRTNRLFSGHELCDCQRHGACCPEEAHTENRFTRVGGSAVSYVAQVISPQWRPHGHVLPGPWCERSRRG